ncbi:hypothetical protein D3C86_1072140 [compost metagenome]
MLHLGGAQDLLVREIRHLAVGAAAYAQIVAKAPVVEVVAALIARLGVGRDLVLLITLGGEHGVTLLIDVPQGVILRQLGRLGGERRVRLYGELIPGEMGRRAVHGLLQIIEGVLQALIRQAVHQIQVEGGQLDGMGQFGGLACLLRAVDTAEAGQLLLLEALHPDGDAVDAGALEAGELVRLNRARVGLHGDLAIRGQGDAGTHPVQQRLHGFHREQTRRTTADKDGGERAPLGPVQILAQILQQGGHVLQVGQLPLLGVGVEVAVGALLDAPGHMDIEGEGRQLQHGVSNNQKSKRGPGWLPMVNEGLRSLSREAISNTGADGPHCR